MTDQTPELLSPTTSGGKGHRAKEAIERALIARAVAGSWPERPDEDGSGVVADYGDPGSARDVRYPPAVFVIIDEVESLRAHEGEYERLINEGRKSWTWEIPLGDVTIDPDEEPS